MHEVNQKSKYDLYSVDYFSDLVLNCPHHI